MLSRTITLLICTFVLFALPMPSFAQETEEYYINDFHAYLGTTNISSKQSTDVHRDDLHDFYQLTNFKPIWFNENGSRKNNVEKFKDAIHKQAYLNGLDQNDYDFDQILNDYDGKGQLTTDQFYEREWKLTNTVMRYISDVRTGRLNLRDYDSKILMPPQSLALAQSTLKALDSWNLEPYLERLVPPHREYKTMRKALENFRTLAQQGGWPKVDINKTLYVGHTHKNVPQIRQRLAASYKAYGAKTPSGIWNNDAQISAETLLEHQTNTSTNSNNLNLIYDKNLAEHVAQFQQMNGQKDDGVVGPQTLRILNHNIEDHIEKIILSMERWRWLPDDLGVKHVRINIPTYYVHAVENGQDAFVMPAIVGEVEYQTPVFSSVIKNVKIHPDWTAPSSIAKRYLIPKIQKNPSIVHSRGYQLIDNKRGRTVPWSEIYIENLHNIDLGRYTFRQKPGKRNALGLARFSVQNDMAIFMHGTPSGGLFNNNTRSNSSGCVRLKDPLTMTQFLLEGQGRSNQELADMYHIEDGEFPKTKYLDLEKDIPIHFMYLTAWADTSGHIHFADDIYERDKKLKAALERLN